MTQKTIGPQPIETSLLIVIALLGLAIVISVLGIVTAVEHPVEALRRQVTAPQSAASVMV